MTPTSSLLGAVLLGLLVPAASNAMIRDPVLPWDSSFEVESQTGFNLLQPVAGARASGGDPIGGVAAALRFTQGDPRYPRWIVAFDGTAGRFPGDHVFYDAHVRGGIANTWEPGLKTRWQELGATIGAGVNGISGVDPAALALPVDLFWRLNVVTRRWPHDPPDHGMSFQIRGRGEPVVLGRAREIMGSAAADVMWYWRGDRARRYDLRFTAVARRMADTTYVGGEIGFTFGTRIHILDSERYSEGPWDR